jgi:hypothetical protein
MKLSESQIRNIVRKELKAVLEMHGRPPMQKMSKEPSPLASAAGGAALASLGTIPFAIAQYLQTDPDMMKKVLNMIQGAGHFIQNLEEE